MAFGGIVGVVLYMLLTDTEIRMAIPTLSVFAMATYKLLPAISRAFSQAAMVSGNLPVIDAMAEDMRGGGGDLLPPAEAYASAPVVPFDHELTLDGVSFQYATAGLPVLHDLHLTLRKGSKCALVGATGCGKSTLIDIVVGLLSPSKGHLRVDGATIDAANVFGWQKHLAYVPQQVFLFDDTIAANIALGIPPESVDRQRLEQAAEWAQVTEFLEGPGATGFDTLVGEQGVRLSGGQRQRIGLARAFYRQPDVLLLDEATSALDALTEESILSAIESDFPDLTVLMIAHRLGSIRFCDHVILLDAGRISDQGTFAELVASNDKFRQMVELAD